jgi:PAS domain S-box-containing protein
MAEGKPALLKVSKHEALPLLLAVAVVLLVGILSYSAWTSSVRRNQERIVSQQIMDGLKEVLSTLKDAETAQRGYLLTGQQSFLDSYREAVTSLSATLNILTSSNSRPLQIRRAEVLRTLINEKIGEMQLTIDLYAVDRVKALTIVSTGRGRRLMDQIRESAAEIEKISAERVLQDSEDQRMSVTTLGLVSTLGSAGLLTLLILSAITIQRGTGRRQQLIEDLERRAVENARSLEELRKSEQTYRAIGEAINYGVWICSPDGRNTYASASLLDLIGMTQEQCSDFGWGNVMHPEDADTTITKWKECVRSGKNWDNEHRFLGRDGRYHWVLARGVPVRDDHGKIVRWAGINLDINQVKAVEAELRSTNEALIRANEDLNQFAFAASHDLQEPLRMITIYSELLVRSYRGQLENDAALYTRFIADGTKRMQRLLADLLDYTLLNSDDERHEGEVDLNLVFQKAVQNVRTAAEETSVAITADQLPVIRAYEPHFLQLLQNLIGNAIKYRSEEPPRVHVGATQRDGSTVLSVADNGRGIDPQYHQQIFGVFKRLHGKEIPGTGIGLAICQRVVNRYGGRIWVESELNRGSTFYCTLPAVSRTRTAGADG